MDWTFFNPKAGARFDAGHGVSLFASIGRGGREPARSDMLQGEDNATVPYDLSARRPRSRSWTPSSASSLRRAPGSAAEVNGYLMAFHHEIAQTGELSEIGLPLRRNVDRSYRRGIEVDLTWRPVEPLQIRHTATYSLNRIDTWTQFYDVYDAAGDWAGSTSRDHDDVPPYVTPAVLANLSADYTPTRGATIGAAWRYVGESHLDNTGNRDFTAPVVHRASTPSGLGRPRAAPAVRRPRAPRLRVAGDQPARQPADVPERLQLPVLHGRTGARASLQSSTGTRYYYPLATRGVFVGLELRF